jgi:hypothetical protein
MPLGNLPEIQGLAPTNHHDAMVPQLQGDPTIELGLPPVAMFPQPVNNDFDDCQPDPTFDYSRSLDPELKALFGRWKPSANDYQQQDHGVRQDAPMALL